MKKLLRLCFFIICAGAFLSTEAQTTGDYQSAATGDWNVAATWQIFNGSAFIAATVSPSSSDGVIKIRTGHIVTVNTGITVDQLIVNAGGTLTQTSTITVADGTGDDITVNGAYNFNSGTLNGAGTFVVNGSMDWQSGNISTNVILGTSAVSGKSTGNTGGIQNGVLTNNGAFNWSAGTITLGNGTFANGATGVITITGDNVMNNNFGTHDFANAGTLTKNGGTGTTTINVNGSNSGTINVTTGIINYNSGGFINTGTINSASGKKFTVSGGNFSLNTGSKSTGAGNFETAGGSVTVNALAATPATATNYLHSGGTINGLGTFQVNGGMDWQLGDISTNVILSTSAVSGKSTVSTGGIQNGVLTNNGAFNWSAGTITLGNGTFANGATGVITVTGDNVMNNNFGTHDFANTGTFTKNGGSGNTTINVSGFNSGTINVTTGIINYNSGGFINTGTINSAIGKKFTVSGGNFSLNTGSKSTGAGNFEVAGGSVTVNAPAITPATATNYLHSGGTINGLGTFQVNGGMDWQSGNISTNVILGTSAVSGKSTGNTGGIQTGVLTNNGAFNWSDGTITLGNGTFANGATGVITVTGDNTMNNNFGTHNFANTGTFTKNGGSGTTTINVNGSNSGTINVTTGIINYNSGGFINTGTINSASGKKFTVSGGNFSLNTGSKSTGTGNFELAGGSVTVNASPATATNYLHSGGTINGSGTFQVNGGMDWQLGDISTNVILGTSAVSSKSTGNTGGIQNGVLTNNGAFNWSAGTITLGNGTFANGATGVITITGDNVMNNNFGTHDFANAGTLTKNGGTGTTTINVNGSNSGTINVTTGIINYNSGGFINTGTINSASGKKFTVSGGNFSLNTGSKSTGAGNFETAGGSVTVNALAATPATATNYLHSGGTINGLGTFQVNGGMDWQLGDISTNVILSTSAVSGKSTVSTGGIQNGVLTNNGAFNWSAGTITLGNGTFANGATGVITVTGDNVMNNNFGSHLFANAGAFAKSNVGTTTITVSADNTGSIKGIGTFNFAGGFTNNGIIAPGSSPGLLTINGAQPLSANSTLNIELLNGSGAGAGNDQLSRDGSLTLAGTLTVMETGLVPAGIYTIINCTSGTINGNFTSVNLPPCYTLQVNSTNVQLTKTLPPKPTITASGPLTFCQGDSVILTSSAASGNLWSNGATTQSITVTSSGNFSVTRTNSSGCTSNPSAAQIVTVNPLPQIPTITASSDTICDGDSVILTSSAASGNLWSNGAVTQSITVTSSGSFTVTTTNANGCASAPSAIKTITVNPLPETPVIVADGSTVKVCPGKTVTLTSSAASSYLWNTGAASQSIIVSQPGSYIVTVINASGCKSESSNIIAVTYRDCAKPVGLLTSNITATSAKLSWTPVTCAVSYQYELRIKGTNAYTVKQQTGVKRTIKGLLPNTIYQWRVKTICSVSPDTVKSAKYSKGPEFTTASAVSAGDLVEDTKASATHLNAIISPNPAHSMATVKLINATGIVQVKLADISGKMMWQNTYAKNQITFSIDVSKLAQGIYMVIIKDENETKVIKLVKE